jgi:Arc/MetJ family transcription regulator
LNSASNDAISNAEIMESGMRTTVAIDDTLMAQARAFAGLDENAAVIRLAVKKYVEREAARRLALLGGSDPQAELPPRRRSEPG